MVRCFQGTVEKCDESAGECDAGQSHHRQSPLQNIEETTVDDTEDGSSQTGAGNNDSSGHRSFAIEVMLDNNH